MEIWKEVKDYEGLYEVSNLGRIKSLSRIVLKKGKYPFLCKEKILKGCIDLDGYIGCSLTKNKKQARCKNHQLVAVAFLNHIPCGMELVVNHINFNKLDNRVENLEIVTNRENCNQKHLKSSSRYTGVCWNKQVKKWQSGINVKGKMIYLGCFEKEIDARDKYISFLKSL